MVITQEVQAQQTMSRRRRNLELLLTLEPEQEPLKRYKFSHNEKFRGWTVWVCKCCGYVRLEFQAAPAGWFCGKYCELLYRIDPVLLMVGEG